MADALAVALMQCRKFGDRDFANLHPSGSLGRRLSTVNEYLRKIDSPIQANSRFTEIVESIHRQGFGVTAVVDDQGQLVGAITDGDIRRSLVSKGADALDIVADQLMSHQPKTIRPDEFAIDALKFMNNNKITQLFVHSKDNICIIRLHDLLEAKIV